MPEPGWLKRQFEKVSAEIATLPSWWREQAGLMPATCPTESAEMKNASDARKPEKRDRQDDSLPLLGENASD